MNLISVVTNSFIALSSLTQKPVIPSPNNHVFLRGSMFFDPYKPWQFPETLPINYKQTTNLQGSVAQAPSAINAPNHEVTVSKSIAHSHTEISANNNITAKVTPQNQRVTPKQDSPITKNTTSTPITLQNDQPNTANINEWWLLCLMIIACCYGVHRNKSNDFIDTLPNEKTKLLSRTINI